MLLIRKWAIHAPTALQEHRRRVQHPAAARIDTNKPQIGKKTKIELGTERLHLYIPKNVTAHLSLDGAVGNGSSALRKVGFAGKILHDSASNKLVEREKERSSRLARPGLPS